VTITEEPYLSSESLLSLASLRSTRLHAANQIRDNLLPTVVDRHKGGQRGATTTSGPGDRKGKRGRVRTELIDLMARILVTVFEAQGGKVDESGFVRSQNQVGALRCVSIRMRHTAKKFKEFSPCLEAC
jgi:hypothetical protein